MCDARTGCKVCWLRVTWTLLAVSARTGAAQQAVTERLDGAELRQTREGGRSVFIIVPHREISILTRYAKVKVQQNKSPCRSWSSIDPAQEVQGCRLRAL